MSTQKESFSAGEAVRISGLNYRTLDHWARTKFIVPSVSDAKGTGTERRYAFVDLIALRVARDLRAAGISTQALRSIVEYLKTKSGLQHPLSEARLVVMGSDVHLVTSCEEITSILRRPGQTTVAFVLDIGRTVEEIRNDVRSIRAA
jgi:DNA-binding transcriptional MerR regulator